MLYKNLRGCHVTIRDVYWCFSVFVLFLCYSSWEYLLLINSSSFDIFTSKQYLPTDLKQNGFIWLTVVRIETYYNWLT